MERNNSKKTMYIWIAIAAVVVIAAAIIIGITMANNNTGSDNTGTSSTDSDTVTAAELKNVNVTVDYGDYATMSTLSSEIQNGRANGKIVKIEGVVSHPGSLYSIMQESADGSGSIGTQFVIEGDGTYPQDGDRVIITGKVVEISPAYYIIKTLPGFIKVQNS